MKATSEKWRLRWASRPAPAPPYIYDYDGYPGLMIVIRQSLGPEVAPRALRLQRWLNADEREAAALADEQMGRA